MLRRVAASLASLALLGAASQPVAADPLDVEHAWVRLPPPGANAAAYLTLRNGTERTRTLVQAASPDCERVEIHRSVVEGGVARMERAGRLELPPGGTLALAPRGLHLMLIQPRRLVEGGRVDLHLELESGGVVEVEAPVRRSGERGGHGAR